MKYNPMLLAGDIGGTKTDLAIFSNEAGPHAPLVQAEVHSAEYPSLQALAKALIPERRRRGMFIENVAQYLPKLRRRDI